VAGDSVVVSHTDLAEFVAAAMERLGVPPASAKLIGESLTAANLRGVDSHGVQLTMAYAAQIRKGLMDPAARGRIARENGACLVYDSENGPGQVTSEICADHAIRLARSQGGLGMVVARNGNHYGASAWWAQQIARAEMIGFVSCSATALVAAWQGRDKILGTNPICMAVPGPDTFLLDMATTTVALNKIHKLRFTGEKTIPAGWALDSEGRPTTDTEAAVKGLPMPLGGYKGSGLAVMVEILCSVLSGGAMMTQMGGLWDSSTPMKASHYFLAVDVSRFMPLDEFAERMKFIRSTVVNSRPAADYDEVMIAGDPEWRVEKIRRREGIPIPQGIWKALTELGASVGVSAPVVA
jgi:LDH2 family malate/lactate/ureidoglycolate dehydrogenase